MTRKLAKVIEVDNSPAIRLDKTVLIKARFEIGDELKYQVRDGEIVFTKKRKTLKDEIQNFYKNGGQYQEPEIYFGDELKGKKSF